MRVLFTTQPAFGHLHPLVPFARALATAGHEVRIASSASFQPQLKATGLESAIAGMDWLESDLSPMSRGLDRAASLQFILEEVFCGSTLRAMVPDLLELADEWQPDVIIREIWEFGGGIAARLIGIPSVVHGIGRWLNVEQVMNAGAGRLRVEAAAAGLAGDDLDWVDEALYIDSCPPFLEAPARRPRPTRSLSVRPAPFDQSETVPALDRWLERLDGDRPLLYVGLGTVMNRRPGVLETLVDGLREVDANVIVTTGPGRSPDEVATLADDIYIASYLPLSQLLPFCDAVVCHAGWSTVISSLTYGIPLVCVPLGADGDVTADLICDGGFGTSLDAEDLSPRAVKRAVEEVLHDDSYGKSAVAARAQIEAMPSPAQLVDAFESPVFQH